MSRDMTVEMREAIEAPVIRPVLLAYLDIQGDPITMWTGPGPLAIAGSPDAALNGKTFLPETVFADMSEISENEGIGGPITVVLQGSHLDDPTLRQLVRDKRAWRGHKAFVWLGMLNEDLNAVYEWPVRIKTGYMVDVKIRRGIGEVSVQMTIDENYQNASAAPFLWTDHARIHPTDTFSSFVVQLANKPGGIERVAIARSYDVPDYDVNEAYIRDQMYNR